MGWYSGHRPKGQSIREYLVSDGLDDSKIVDIAVKHRTTAYIAYQSGDEVVALVYMLRFTRDYFNTTYKALDENMGPVDAECPERILDLLTPTENENAIEWRAQCRKNIAVRRAVKKGTLVKFSNPIKFTNGVTLAEAVYSGRGNRFFDPAGPEYGRYTVSRWIFAVDAGEVLSAA